MKKIMSDPRIRRRRDCDLSSATEPAPVILSCELRQRWILFGRQIDLCEHVSLVHDQAPACRKPGIVRPPETVRARLAAPVYPSARSLPPSARRGPCDLVLQRFN